MKQIAICISALMLWSFTSLKAQIISANSVNNDTIVLQHPEVTNASYQWQYSPNQINWQDLAGESQLQLRFTVQTTMLPAYYRLLITEPGCEPYFSEVFTLERDMPTYYWSDNNAWDSGQKPVQGEVVTIPSGRRIILDENTPALSGLVINGELEFMERDLSLTSEYIVIHGSLQIGTSEQPFTHNATITLTGSNPNQNIMGMGTRGIMVMDGRLDLHGSVPEVVWTRINGHINSGSTTINLDQEVDWQIGDEIALSPTDYYLAGNNTSLTQRLTIQSVNGSQLIVNEAINAFRWGLLQYATANGLSLEPNNLLLPPAADNDSMQTPLVLDERAFVGLLTRNITIEAPADNLWNSQGFGVHVMVMGSEAEARLEAVQIKRGGQRGRLGRYPIHWHMMSYSGTQTLPDVENQYFRNSAVNHSTNRGIVIHGTNGLEVRKNVVFNVEGHGIFTEDAVERRNIIDSNLVLRIRRPQLPANQALKQHEVAEHGASGFWISNPDNTITNNVAGDCASKGFWLAFTANPWGESSSVLAEDGLLMNPSRIRFGVFDNNTAFSNGREGIMLDEVEIDNEGNTFPRQYMSTTNGRDPQWPFETLRRFTLSNYKVWKNGHNGIWDRAVWATNYGAVAADNCQRYFAGSGADGIIDRSLVIGTSLNHMMNGTDRPFNNFGNFPNGQSYGTPVGFATYHSTFDIRNNIVMNFPAVENTWSGVFSTDDYYTRAVELGQVRNTNNLIINSHPGVKLRAEFDYFTLASCLWDPHGVWGPPNNFFVYDDVFLTYGKTITPVTPSTAIAGGVSVSGPFYGFEGFVLHGVGDTPPQNQPYMDLMGLHVQRFDQNMQEVATWDVAPAPNANAILQHMRDFATSPDGIYRLTFSAETMLPTNFQMNVENMTQTSDVQVIGIQYDCSLNPIVLLQSPGSFRLYEEVNSLADVVNSNGETWFKDVANNTVWVKIQGGHWQFWINDPTVAVPTADDLLYNTSVLRIYQP